MYAYTSVLSFWAVEKLGFKLAKGSCRSSLSADRLTFGKQSVLAERYVHLFSLPAVGCLHTI